MRLSEKLIQLRKDKGWTQAIAARNIDIQQSYLSKLENGRYLPSEEVITKLSRAYGVPEKELSVSNTVSSSGPKYWLLGLLVGLVISISGYLGLFFPQTYYTYKATPVESSEASGDSLSYHLTDQYNGERYVTEFAGTQYEYVLIAERDILRTENRWLMASGLVLILFAVGYPVIARQLTHKES